MKKDDGERFKGFPSSLFFSLAFFSVGLIGSGGAGE